jgi:hypothetical protein
MHGYNYKMTASTDLLGDRTATGRWAAFRLAISFVIVGACALASGCGPATIWSAQSRSPDGLWLASARTLENSGFGTGAFIAEVFLKRTNVSKPPQAILSFWHDPSLASPQPRN